MKIGGRQLQASPRDESASQKSHRKSSTGKKSELSQMLLPPLNTSGEFTGSFKKASPKKSRENSLNKSQDMKKLPKASQNIAYTMEKFVPEGSLTLSLENQRTKQRVKQVEGEDFDRDSDN